MSNFDILWGQEKHSGALIYFERPEYNMCHDHPSQIAMFCFALNSTPQGPCSEPHGCLNCLKKQPIYNVRNFREIFAGFLKKYPKAAKELAPDLLDFEIKGGTRA